MQNENRDHDDDVALFRYGLIADLLHLEPGTGSGLFAKLRDKAERAYQIPGTLRSRVAAETIRSWLRLYRDGGFAALRPRRRADAGRARRLPQDVVDLLISLKEEHPDYTVQMVIDQARLKLAERKDLVLKRSTVHRQLKLAGVMDKKREDPSSKDRRRFCYQRAGELWMSDVMHGPAVYSDGRRKRKTYLIAFLDDATRIIPFAAFAFGENVNAFLPVFREAVLRRGIPMRLFVDNGAAYRSRHLALVCAKLGVTLIHARPYQPAGKGKQERWFRTVRMGLLPTLGEQDLQSLATLNRRLWAWVEGEYHHSPHRGLDGFTPFDAWAMRAGDVVLPGPELDLDDLFRFEQKRKVQKDRTLSLGGVVYEVDAALVGETVLVRYDPWKSPQGDDPSKPGAPVDIWWNGKKIQTARTVDAYANCFVKRNHNTRMLEASRSPDLPAPGLNLTSLSDRKET